LWTACCALIWGLFLKVLQHLTLPAITLGLVLSGVVGRISRANMLEVLDKEYIKTARSKGLPESRVIVHHALRNAMIPIVTVVGLQFALLLGGAILTETVFNWPGLAQYLLRAINARDYPAIQGTVVFITLFISTVNLIVDLLYSRLDPRVRY
jgi:peptide/nickel transport system permease protein